ncbi:MAG TPA: DUF6163 family protein [Xanthobacteraceae bacterium]
MIEPIADQSELAPVRAGEEHPSATWTQRLVLFLRVMAVLSMLKGLRHWAAVCGFGLAPEGGFEAQTLPWQAATVFFAVIDLVAAVGLWLSAPWGAVVWLTAAVSMIVVEVFFPLIYGDLVTVLLLEPAAIIAYLVLAILAAREQPQ